jgi:hypothetical protein
MTGALQVARLMQLAHAVKDANGRAYNRTKYREQRHKMMQHWSDYLDSLQVGNVVSVRFGGAKNEFSC